MKYYKTEDLLIQLNPETKVYKIRNNVGIETKLLTKEEFEASNAIEIKKPKLCELMNQYFKDVKHSWVYKGVRFKKLPNFEGNGINACTNYNFKKDILKHELEDKKYGKLAMVYHWGRVYYFTWSYNGYPQGQLINPTTLELVRWARPKHCAPILNEDTNVIV